MKKILSLVQYDKLLSKFGQQHLVMVNYACGINSGLMVSVFVLFAGDIVLCSWARHFTLTVPLHPGV